MTTRDGGPSDRPPIASHLRGNRRPARAAGRRGRRRPRSRRLVRRDARLARRPGLPQPQHALPARRRAGRRRRRRPRRAITARLPDAFVRDLGANPGFGAAANEVLRLVEGDNGFFCFCHDDVALEPDAVRAARRGAVPLERRRRRPEARLVGRPRRAPARRARPRPLRRGRPDHRAGRVRPGAARRRRATCSSCRRPACSCGPTCSARSAASTRRSRSTATTSTCAGGPT